MSSAKWKQLLDPQALRPRLIFISLFITLYEMLKSSIIKRIEDFFITGFVEAKITVDPKYKESLAATGQKKLLDQSLVWLKNHDAIDDTDIATVHEIREYRNKLAHQIAEMVTGYDPALEVDLFQKASGLLRKIEVWWIQNVEIPTNPDYDGKEIKDDEISSGTELILKLMVDVGLGEEKEAERYLREFEKLNAKQGQSK